jgi:hypothetical protein
MGAAMPGDGADSAEFVVSFNGPGVEDGRIDVRDLAPALLSLGRLIDAANLVIYGEKQPIKIEARAISVGSFEVYLQAVSSGWDTLTHLMDGGDATHAKQLLEWLGIFGVPIPGVTALVGLYRWLNGKKPNRVTRAEAGQFLVEIDGRTIIVPLEVMRLYQDIAVNKAFSELLASTEGDSVDSIEFRPDGSPKDSPTLVLTKADRPSFSIEEPPAAVVIDDTRRAAFSIRSLAFQEGNKWRLFDGQNTITATIEDRDFIGRVDANLVRFAKGDILICEVRTVQFQGRDGLKTEHSVLRRHRRCDYHSSHWSAPPVPMRSPDSDGARLADRAARPPQPFRRFLPG